jgi:hypothetical protein
MARAASGINPGSTTHTLRHYADHRTMPTGTKAKSLAELSDGVFVNLKLPSRAA